MKRTTITLSDDLAELVALEARRKGTSVSGVVRDLVERGLTGSAERPRQIAWAGLFSDPEMAPARGLDAALAEGWADDLDRDRR